MVIKAKYVSVDRICYTTLIPVRYSWLEDFQIASQCYTKVVWCSSLVQ